MLSSNPIAKNKKALTYKGLSVNFHKNGSNHSDKAVYMDCQT